MVATTAARLRLCAAANCDGVAFRSGGRPGGRIRSAEVRGPPEAHWPGALKRQGAHWRWPG
eukprot:6393158-Alexandrium_andersonii.AAC.1